MKIFKIESIRRENANLGFQHTVYGPIDIHLIKTFEIVTNEDLLKVKSCSFPLTGIIDLKIYNFLMVSVYNLHPFQTKKPIYNLQEI